METFITLEEIETRIKSHPDLTAQDRERFTDKASLLGLFKPLTEIQHKPILHNTRQTNNGKKRLQPRSSN